MIDKKTFIRENETHHLACSAAGWPCPLGCEKWPSGNESGLDLRSLPLEDPLLLARLREMAEDWRYSDEFIGKVVRAHLGRKGEQL